MTDDKKVVHLHGVHPMRPEVLGRSFSEIAGLSPETLAALCEREMVFTTTFTRQGKTYGGDVIARDWAHAQTIADGRGLGETVDGILCEVIPA